MKGFRDSTIFLESSLTEQYRQVMRALSPRLVKSIGTAINNMVGITCLRRDGRVRLADNLRHNMYRLAQPLTH